MKRSRLEMIVDLLETIRKNPNFSKSRAFWYSGIHGHGAGHLILSLLQKKGFVELTDCSYKQTVKLTLEGFDWLKRAQQVLQEIREEA